MPNVEARRVGVLEPSHALDQIRLRGEEGQMLVVAHEHPCEDLPSSSATGIAQRSQERSSILVVEEDRFETVTTSHHVVDGVLILDSRRPGHG